MAFPPTIPTSFVPHAASAPARRFRSDFTGAFGYFSYSILGIVFMLALGVFFYNRLLISNEASKRAEVVAAQGKIDPATVEAFVRLRDRLNSGTALLEQHTAFSGFFLVIERILPASVRFATLHISLDGTGAAKIEGSGVAKSFNVLAAASNAFATDGRIKDAIFSNISVNRDGSVSFALSAMLDPKLIAFTPTATPTPTVIPSNAAATSPSSLP